MERNRIIDWGLGEDLVEEDLTAGEGDVEENVGVGQEFFSHQIIPRPIRHWNSLSLSLSLDSGELSPSFSSLIRVDYTALPVYT